jgi:hypothetical protein
MEMAFAWVRRKQDVHARLLIDDAALKEQKARFRP